MEPDLTIVIPAFNEEDFLPPTLAGGPLGLDAASAELGLSGEIVVVDNNSTDRTAEVARQHGAGAVVFEPVNQISRARNAGARSARGQYLVFLDADTLLPAPLLVRALSALESSEACGGGTCLEPDQPFPAPLNWLFSLWNKLSVARAIAAGSFVFCRKDAFDAIGGFDQGVYAGEELWLSLRLKRWGKKWGMKFVVFDSPRVITSARKGAWFGSGVLALQMFILLLCPWATRSRWFCWTWYRRPVGPKTASQAPAAPTAAPD